MKILKKLLTSIHRLFDERRKKSLTNTLGHIGKSSEFGTGIRIIGGKYISIGDGFYAGPGCRIEAWDRYNEKCFSPSISIGNNVRINSSCHIGAINKVIVGDNVLFGSGVFITDHSHGKTTYEELIIPPNERDLYSKGEVVVGDNCWICENAIILPGVHIGNNSVIGAGAVVSHDIPPFSIVVGNPGRVVRALSKEDSYSKA